MGSFKQYWASLEYRWLRVSLAIPLIVALLIIRLSTFHSAWYDFGWVLFAVTMFSMMFLRSRRMSAKKGHRDAR